jgi:hypothetical protein
MLTAVAILLLFLVSFIAGVAAGSAIGWPLSGANPRLVILKHFRRLAFEDQRDVLARLDMEIRWPDQAESC